MKRLIGVISLIALLSVLAPSARGQLTIVNPRQLNVSPEKARLLLNIAHRVVTAELKHHDLASEETTLTLVLGEPNERYEEQAGGTACTLYLKQWDEEKFTRAAMSYALYRLAHSKRMDQMIGEVLRRTNLAAPVSVEALRREQMHVPSAPAGAPESACFTAIHAAALREVSCSPAAPGRR